jgi:hypothetical protein
MYLGLDPKGQSQFEHHQLQLDRHLYVIRHRLALINNIIYVLQSAIIPRLTYTSQFVPLRISNRRSWTKRSSNGDAEFSDSLLHSTLQSSSAGTSSSSPCRVTQYKPPNSDASGAVKPEVPARLPSPTASSNEPLANKPTIPPTHRQLRRSKQLHPRTAAAHCEPTPSQKSMLTQDSPSANPPLPTQQDHRTSSPPAQRWPQ